jgi:LmbE family N-acetylglucosaminyl deacetylase
MNTLEVPQVSVEALAARLKSDEPFVLLDVRENWEVKRAAIHDHRLQVAPMSRLPKPMTPKCTFCAISAPGASR